LRTRTQPCWSAEIPLNALVYRSGVGKDALVSYPVAEHGYQRLAFATGVKVMLARFAPVLDPFVAAPLQHP